MVIDKIMNGLKLILYTISTIHCFPCHFVNMDDYTLRNRLLKVISIPDITIFFICLIQICTLDLDLI